jgi:cyclophilin family peptidyl-prolyl cis-trans isomerase/HEAT repeat protein
VAATVAAIVAVADASDAPLAIDRLGLARAFFFLTRQPASRDSLPATAFDAMRTLLRESRADASASSDAALRARRTRTTAAAALIATGAATPADHAAILEDDDPFVRRESAAGLAGLRDAGRAALVARAVADPSAVVRFDALRTHARIAQSAGCAAVAAAIGDADAHVRLLAIDLTATHCPPDQIATRLDSIAVALPAADTGWHAAAHALVSLAALDPQRAGQRIDPFVVHGSPFVRAWAARAAATLADTATLLRFARDPHPHVRTAAVTGLAATVGHAADTVYLAQLREDDSQLVLTAADALAGSRHDGVVPQLLDALARFTQRRRETERDARSALLRRIAELGSATNATAIEPYLQDYDEVIADLASETIAAWTGTRPATAPQPLPEAPVPSVGELQALAGARVTIEMMNGDAIELRLRPWDAPTNAARFARLSRQGYFDGLTLHRVVPNFVVQGGSPNANEYAGDGPFTRDELVIDANWRAMVGLSTRGRDTGDAQFYFNTIDNIRLDHDYTVFADVVRGMDAVDRILEGAVMRRVIVR